MKLTRMAVMFFIKYYVLGCLYTTLGLVLGTHGLGGYIGFAYAIGGFAALFASMVMGEVADRFVLPNNLLLIGHVVSGVALWLMPHQVLAGHAYAFLSLLFVYTIFGDATMPLCTRIAFHALGNDVHRYSVARAFGTAGFLCAGLVTGFSGLSTDVATFRIGAAASLALALYALTLPFTPAAGTRSQFRIRDLMGWDTFSLFRDRTFVVFMILAIAIFFPMAAYNAYVPVFLGENGISNVSGLMTLGQVTEIILMFFLAFLIRYWGLRNIFAAAGLAWFAILVLFAVGDRMSLTLITIGILLRGIGWDFFYASSEVYLNSKSSEEIKARAQTLLRTATYGLGTILGSLFSGMLYNSLRHGESQPAREQWPLFWGLVSVVPALMLVMVLLFFKNDVDDTDALEAAAPAQT